MYQIFAQIIIFGILRKRCNKLIILSQITNDFKEIDWGMFRVCI